MENAQQLAQRTREVLLNGKWVANTNFKNQLNDLSWEEATYKIGSLNTIAALTFHINYYLAGVCDLFEGGKLEIRDKYSFDLKPINSEEDWKTLKDELFYNSERFAAHVETMSADQLGKVFVDKNYGTYRRNIEGMIEHAYYHLGQVGILKKMIAERLR